MSDDREPWWAIVVYVSLSIYLTLSIFLWIFRASFGSCEKQYMDYVFPLTFLHCPIEVKK